MREEIIIKNDSFNYQRGDNVNIRKCLLNLCWEEKFKGQTVGLLLGHLLASEIS